VNLQEQLAWFVNQWGPAAPRGEFIESLRSLMNNYAEAAINHEVPGDLFETAEGEVV
jgi:hypothetical protein